ncbi:EamA family transporter, partial [Aeromonas caviae]
MDSQTGWFYWAFLSAIFAALTAIFAKVGVEGVDSDLATLIRTGVIIVVLSAFIAYTGKWANPFGLTPETWIFLTLSGLATGVSWAGREREHIVKLMPVQLTQHPVPFPDM